MAYAQVTDASRVATLRGTVWLRWLQTAAYAPILWRDRVAERRHLCSLSDHMLADIGLTHSDVAWESGKPFWRA